MTEILKVQGLTKQYHGSGGLINAVDDISFSVGKGEIFGLLGPNGAGKTSTIKCICGLLEFEKGHIHINNTSIKENRGKGLRHISAVLEGNRNIYWRMTVAENLIFFSGINGLSRKSILGRMDYLLEQFQLTSQKNTIVNHLSRGMKQKVAIAISLITNKDIILLDEPTLGLDVGMSHEMRILLREIAKEEGKTILLSTHDMNVVEETCDSLVIINKGKVIAHDSMRNLKSLFNQLIYKIVLDKELSTTSVMKLKSTLTNLEQDTLDGNLHLKLSVKNPNDLFFVFNLIQEEKAELLSLDKINMSFEEIFINLVQEAEGHEVSK